MGDNKYHKGLIQGNVVKCISQRYVQVPTKICFETEISGKAIGYYVKLLSLPEGFHFTVTGFAELFKDGRDCVRGGLQELEAYGYLIRAQRRASGGQYNDDTVWIALDEPSVAMELRAFLEKNGYMVLSKPVKSTAPAPHIDYEKLTRMLEAVEKDYTAMLEEDLKAAFGPADEDTLKALGKLPKTSETAEGQPSGKESYPQSQYPRSEPMTGFPTSVVTCEDGTSERDTVENHGGENGERENEVVENQQNPRSEPMTGFPTSVATCEDSENFGSLPRSEPMTGFPSSGNPTQFQDLYRNTYLITPSNSTKPETESTCQVEPIGAPDRAEAERVLVALEKLAGGKVDDYSRQDCITVVKSLMSEGLDEETITAVFKDPAPSMSHDIAEWLLSWDAPFLASRIRVRLLDIGWFEKQREKQAKAEEGSEVA